MRVFLRLFFCFTILSAANVGYCVSSLNQEIGELKEVIAQKQQRRDNFQGSFDKSLVEIKKLERENNSLNIDLKQVDRETKKIQSMASSPPSAKDDQLMNKVKYKRKVAEISLKKNHAEIKALQRQEERSSQSIHRLDRLLVNLKTELAQLNEQKKESGQARAQQAKKNKQARKAKQQRLAKQQRKQKLALEAQKKSEIEAQQAQEEAKAIKERQQEDDALAQRLANMPPAQAAMIRAQHIAQEFPLAAPKLGDSPSLKVENPVNSTPKNIGSLRHLGNSQYSMSITMRKGRQKFIIGEHSFIKAIPKHFHGLTSLVIIDARSEDVSFQLISSH